MSSDLEVSNSINVGKDNVLGVSSFDSIICGSNNRITNTSCLAVGQYVSVSGECSIALGKGEQNNLTVSHGSQSIALGKCVQALGDNSLSFGSNNISKSKSSIAIGDNIESLGTSSVCIGSGYDTSKSMAIQDYSVAIGNQVIADGVGTVVMGQANKSEGMCSFVVGQSNNAKGQYVTVSGYSNKVEGELNTVFGQLNNVTDNINFVYGTSNKLSGDYGNVSGNANKMNGHFGFVFGNSNESSGSYSIVFGKDSIGLGDFSFICGDQCVINNDNSIAIGNKIKIYGKHSYVYGTNHNVNSNSSFVLGNNANTFGDYCLSFGNNNSSSGDMGLLLGSENNNEGDNNYVFGSKSNVKQNNNYIFGEHVRIKGNSNYVFGNNNRVDGNGNVMIGNNINYNKNNTFVIGSDELVHEGKTRLSDYNFGSSTYGLIHYWTMNNKYDMITNTRVIDNKVNRDRHGRQGGLTYNFEVQSYVDTSIRLDVSRTFSVSFWVKLNEKGYGNQVLLYQHNNFSIYVEKDLTNLCVKHMNDDMDYYIMNKGKNVGLEEYKWQLISYVYEYGSKEGRVYINNEFVGNSKVGDYNNFDKTLIIGNNHNDDECMSGSISDVRVYSRVLSENEINDLYNMNNVIGMRLIPRSHGRMLDEISGEYIKGENNVMMYDGGIVNKKCMYFNGMNSYIASYIHKDKYNSNCFKYSVSYNNSFSMSFWIKPNGSVRNEIGNMDLVSLHTNGGRNISDNNFRIVLVKHTGKIKIYHKSDNENNVDANSICWNTWNHIVYTHEAGETVGKLYINGKGYECKDIETTNSPQVGLTIGATGEYDVLASSLEKPTTNFYDGYMDDFCIYQTSLSEDYVQKIYKNVNVSLCIGDGVSGGRYNLVSGNSIVLGNNNIGYGGNNYVNGSSNIVYGNKNKVSNDYSMCIGEQNNVTEYGSLVVGNNNFVKDSYMVFDNNFGDNKGKEKSMYIGGDYHFRMQDIEEDCINKLKKLKMKGDYVNMSKLMMLMLGAIQEMINDE